MGGRPASDVSGLRGLQCGTRWLDLSRPSVMGILNVTPDSFSDGGVLASAATGRFHVSVAKALHTARAMADAGAGIVDVGGESTRPGATPVSEQEELDRVIPVVEAITAELDVVVSVDTSTAAVITAAASAGAGMVNDVRALRRPGALAAAAGSQMAVCVMHMLGEPGDMQLHPDYKNVVNEVMQFLRERAQYCDLAGIARSRICIDPGFGFGKTVSHNYQLLASLSQIVDMGWPVLVGMSRKSMIGHVLNQPAGDRLAGSLAAATLAAGQGASIIRVHDVKETVDAMRIVSAMKNPSTDNNDQ